MRTSGEKSSASVYQVWIQHVALFVAALTTIATFACTSAPRSPSRDQSSSGAGGTGIGRQQTTIRLVTRFEVQSLAAKFDEPGGGSGPYAKRPFNAGLAVIDSGSRARPVLAER